MYVAKCGSVVFRSCFLMQENLLQVKVRRKGRSKILLAVRCSSGLKDGRTRGLDNDIDIPRVPSGAVTVCR